MILPGTELKAALLRISQKLHGTGNSCQPPKDISDHTVVPELPIPAGTSDASDQKPDLGCAGTAGADLVRTSFSGSDCRMNDNLDEVCGPAVNMNW